MGPATVIELADALCVIVALVSGALLLRARRQLREALRCCAVLDTVPLRGFRWNTARGKNREAARPPAYAEFLAGVGADDAARLEAARLTLRSAGVPFSGHVAMRSGGAYLIEGRRAGCGEDVLGSSMLRASRSPTAREGRLSACVRCSTPSRCPSGGAMPTTPSSIATGPTRVPSTLPPTSPSPNAGNW